MHNLGEAIFEDFLSAKLHVYQVTFCLLLESLEFSLEDEPFVVKSKHVGSGDGYFENGDLKNAKCGPGGLLS